MKALKRNEETGFLESRNANQGTQRQVFNSDKKLLFLQMVNDCIDSGKYPLTHEICRAVGVSVRVFELHVQNDPVFAEEWAEIRKRLLSVFTGKLAFKADQKMGTLANIAMLRYLETGSWVQREYGQSSADTSSEKKLSDAKMVIIDGEIDHIPTLSEPQAKTIDNQSAEPPDNASK